MPFQSLISKETEVTLLTVERRTIMNHFGMDLDFVDPLHVIAELIQVFDVSVTDFTNHVRWVRALLLLLLLVMVLLLRARLRQLQ